MFLWNSHIFSIIKVVISKSNQSWIFIGRTDAEAPILWPPDVKSWLTAKDPGVGCHFLHQNGSYRSSSHKMGQAFIPGEAKPPLSSNWMVGTWDRTATWRQVSGNSTAPRTKPVAPSPVYSLAKDHPRQPSQWSLDFLNHLSNFVLPQSFLASPFHT